MSIEIKVPAMGESVTEATIARWLKKEGDAVKQDEPLVELETDKVSVEVPSPAAGVLEHIEVQQGGTVGVGTVLGQVSEGARQGGNCEAGASRSAEAGIAKPEGESARLAPVPPPPPSVRRIAEEEKLDTGAIAGTGKRGQVTKADALAALEAVKPARPSGPHPSPSVRARARRARRAREDVAAAQDHRAAPEGKPGHRRPAHHLQRSRTCRR